MNPTPKQISRTRAVLSVSFGCIVTNLAFYHDGFSFTVPTELDAYKVAYKYQGPGIDRTVVKFAPNVNLWSVQIYNKEN